MAPFRSFQSGRVVLNDYDYRKPPANLLADKDQPGGYAHGSMEMFDYPGRYDQTSEGKTLAQVRLEADQALDDRRAARGRAPSLFPGCLVTLDNHPISSENIEYLTLSCTHSLSGQAYRSGMGWQGQYSGGYVLLKSERPFRARAVARKPRIHGAQSALVVGKSGEEIDVDELGRICLQFYWDRKKTVSRRVRVAQFWAGAHCGSLFLPRIGDEVMVAYEDGDPDRPIVVGSVYNGTNTVPADLPPNKTFSGILTKSSKGGNGWNMLLFDDTAGSERVKVRAEKDLVARVNNDERRAIGRDQKEDITGNVTKTVGGDETITVGSTGGTYSLTATKKIVLTVGQSSLTIDPSGITLRAPTITIKADAETSVAASVVSVTGDATVTISGASTQIGEAVTIAGELTTPAISWGAASGSPPVPA